MTTLLSLDLFFVLMGVLLAALAGRIATDASHPRRWGSALFWSLLAVVCVALLALGEEPEPVGEASDSAEGTGVEGSDLFFRERPAERAGSLASPWRAR